MGHFKHKIQCKYLESTGDEDQQCIFLIQYLLLTFQQIHEFKSGYLRQLIVNPEMLAKKIKAMKDNKSPGVDGIPPTLLMQAI